jgi:hypothetical protein
MMRLLNRLLNKGYTLQDIVQVIMEMEIIKASRAANWKPNRNEKMFYALDSAGKTLRKIAMMNFASDKLNNVHARSA